MFNAFSNLELRRDLRLVRYEEI